MPNIVACTAYVSEDIRKSCFEVGMKEFINKPVSQSEIKKCIARLSVTWLKYLTIIIKKMKILMKKKEANFKIMRFMFIINIFKIFL